MKTNKIIYGLSFIAVVTICTFNIQNSFSVSNELGYSNLTDLLKLNSASAETGGGTALCSGTTCDEANNRKYGLHIIGNIYTCCGIALTKSGKKSS